MASGSGAFRNRKKRLRKQINNQTGAAIQQVMIALLRKAGFDAVAEYRFDAERLWRFDVAVPACKVAIEIEGGIWSKGRHIRPLGFIGDMEKYNAAGVLGWRVLRCHTTLHSIANPEQVCNQAIVCCGQAGLPPAAQPPADGQPD